EPFLVDNTGLRRTNPPAEVDRAVNCRVVGRGGGDTFAACWQVPVLSDETVTRSHRRVVRGADAQTATERSDRVSREARRQVAGRRVDANRARGVERLRCVLTVAQVELEG